MANNSPNTSFLEKLPPQSIEAEKSLLGCLMLDKNTIIRVADFLLPKDFYKKIHQEIYNAVLDIFGKGEPIDILSVSTRLKEKNFLEDIGGNSYLTELINSVPTASHAQNYAKIIQRKRILRDLIEASQEIGVMGYNESEDIDILLDKAEKRIFSIAQKGLTQNFLPVKASLEDAFERIDRLFKHKERLRGLATGFTDLDNILAGLQKADLIILASRPSLGKSAMALNLAANIAISQKMPVGIFSLEMSRDQVVDRLISTQSNVDLWRLRTGRLSAEGDDNDFSRIQQAMGVLSEAPIYIDDVATSNILQMRAMARRLQSEKGLGLVIVDYLQLMEPRNTEANIVQQMSEISRSLKGLAKELNVPVLALSQLSRAVEHRSPPIPRLSDLRESGCLTGDTLIVRADTGERVCLKDLVGQTNIPVYSLDENWKLKEMKISKVFSSGQKMIHELETKSGRKIKASANHPFRKLKGWERLDQLKVGDKIALPRILPLIKNPLKIEDERIVLLAHLIGDGSYIVHDTPTYTSPSKKNVKITKGCAERAFNIKAKVYLNCPSEGQTRILLAGKNKKSKNEINEINSWLRKLGIFGQRCSVKEIPELIFRLSNAQIALFIKHLWATDGSIFMAKQGKNYVLSYSSTSKKLIIQLQHLLLRIGIISNQISERNHKGQNWKPEYQLRISDKEHQLEFLKNIGIFGREQEVIKAIRYIEAVVPKPKMDIIPREAWKTIAQVRTNYSLPWRDFAEELEITSGALGAFGKCQTNIGRRKMIRILTVLPDPRIEKIAKSDIFWDEIISITPLKVEEVYDATVPETHNFIANDIILHNSIEQDADVVLFIHREDRYRSDSPKKSIADIIIAKHRNGPVGKVELYFDEKVVSFRNLEKGSYESYGE